MKNVLTRKVFLRLWQQIIVDGDFRFMWPQRKILNALEQKRVLRFVREELFEPSLQGITNAVLLGCYRRDYGLLVKTSSVNVVNYIGAIKKIKHCIIFSVTDLLKNYRGKVRAINILVKEGLNVTLSLAPIFEFNNKTEYILSLVNKNVLGVEVGWLHGSPSLIPPEYLNRDNYKFVRREKQYKLSHLKNVVEDIRLITEKRKLQVRFYFSSYFSNGKPCCFADNVW